MDALHGRARGGGRGQEPAGEIGQCGCLCAGRDAADWVVPELNGQENIWQFMRQNWLSNRIFKSFDDIVDNCCYAWNTLIDQP